MQTIECSIGNSFVVDHNHGSTRVTVLSAADNEVTLRVEELPESEHSGYRDVVVTPQSNGDILELLSARGRG